MRGTGFALAGGRLRAGRITAELAPGSAKGGDRPMTIGGRHIQANNAVHLQSRLHANSHRGQKTDDFVGFFFHNQRERTDGIKVKKVDGCHC
jgi:hypothetical protein